MSREWNNFQRSYEARPKSKSEGKEKMKHHILSFFIVLTILFPIMAYSDEENPFANSLENNRHLAETGDPEGQYQLGKHFDYGWGVDRDALEAAKWYEKAAIQGHIEAQHALGLLNTHAGNYIFATPEESVKWFRAAAEQGHPSSQHFLADAYFKGKGVVRNYEEAAKWYQKASIQGEGMSMYGLAILYAKGLGLPKDLVKAYAWNNVSATQSWGMAKQYREELEKIMNAKQIAEGQKLSIELFKKYGKEPKN